MGSLGGCLQAMEQMQDIRRVEIQPYYTATGKLPWWVISIISMSKTLLPRICWVSPVAVAVAALIAAAVAVDQEAAAVGAASVVAGDNKAAGVEALVIMATSSWPSKTE